MPNCQFADRQYPAGTATDRGKALICVLLGQPARVVPVRSGYSRIGVVWISEYVANPDILAGGTSGVIPMRPIEASRSLPKEIFPGATSGRFLQYSGNSAQQVRKRLPTFASTGLRNPGYLTVSSRWKSDRFFCNCDFNFARKAAILRPDFRLSHERFENDKKT